MNVIGIMLTRPTRPASKRHQYIQRAVDALKLVEKFHLIVVDDNDKFDGEVYRILNDSRINCMFGDTEFGKTRNFYREQKTYGVNMAIEYFSSGIIYIMEHDHYWHPKLWDELRQVDNVGVLPLGNTSPDPGGCERPIIVDGKLYCWSAAYSGRRFPVSTGAWAINREIVERKDEWWSSRKGNDSAFLAKLLSSRYLVEPLCDHCNYVYAWQKVSLGDPMERGEWPRLDLPRFELIERT